MLPEGKRDLDGHLDRDRLAETGAGRELPLPRRLHCFLIEAGSDAGAAVLAELPLREATLEDLSAEFGVSRERVRQIEVRAFEKVQRAVKNRLAAMESRPNAPALHAH